MVVFFDVPLFSMICVPPFLTVVFTAFAEPPETTCTPPLLTVVSAAVPRYLTFCVPPFRARTVPMPPLLMDCVPPFMVETMPVAFVVMF